MTYGTRAEFDTYIALRGLIIPSDADNDDKDAALLVASEWIDNVYGDFFTGTKTDGFNQVREWPRKAAYTNTDPQYIFTSSEIPERVKQAAYEAAVRQLNEPGVLDKDFEPSLYTSVSVEDAISVEFASHNQSSDIQIKIAKIEQLLLPLFDQGRQINNSNLSGGAKRL